MSDVALFDRFASFYDRFATSTSNESIRAGFAYAERPVERVLDLAGGTGQTATSLEAYDVTVLDASLEMLRRARWKGFPVVCGDATRLPLPGGSFDGVVVTDALHHVGNARAAVREAARVLRPGGVLVAREFDPRGLRGRALVAGEHAIGFESAFFTPGTLAGAFADAGLRPHAVESGFEYALAGVRD